MSDRSEGKVPNTLVVAWMPFSPRSQLLAERLGADLHLVHYLRHSTPWLAPVRYPLQMMQTLSILWRERPALVIAQNPPFPCGLAVYLYGWFHPVRYALDWHSAAFAQIWDWAAPIQRFLARQALVNIVTNAHWQARLASWGAITTVLIDVPAQFPAAEPYPLEGAFTVAMVSTMAPDEPLEVVMQAASGLPDVRFYVTGDKARKPGAFLAQAPANVVFTDFLPREEYVRLLRSADAVMSLTTRDHTMQRGGCEAVWLGQPLITSDWPLLREAFHLGTVHVPNTVEGIQEGVGAVRAGRRELAQEMQRLQAERQQIWADFAHKFHLLGEGDENPFAQ